MFHKGQIVVFGRECGEQTIGKVLRVNARTISVVTLEARGASARKGAGRKWRVGPSLCRAATDAEIVDSGADQTNAREARSTKARRSRRPARPVRDRPDAEILRDIFTVECNLSPGTLTCDGELAPSLVRKRATKLNAERRRLVRELGRDPSYNEIWNAA